MAQNEQLRAAISSFGETTCLCETPTPGNVSLLLSIVLSSTDFPSHPEIFTALAYFFLFARIYALQQFAYIYLV